VSVSLHSTSVRLGLLALLCLVLWLPGLTTLPPFDRDESRFAQASHQMVESGDYVDIRFQDQPRHKKPIGIYWLQSASAKLSGASDQIWAYRIPSLLGALLAVLLTAQLGARYISPLGGLMAGGLLATCLLLGVEARMAKTDAVLLACITAMMYPLLRLALDGGLSRAQAACFWVALGLGILVKGPIILIPLVAVAVGVSLANRSAQWLRGLQPVWGGPLLLALVLPWLVAITVKTGGAFWAESVGHDLAAKVAGGQEGHGAPPGFYIGTFFLTFWPWAPLMLLALPVIWAQRRVPLVRVLLLWLVPFWLAFELFPTKLMHYTMPTFPAVALLLAYTLTQPQVWQPLTARARWWRGGVTGLAVLLIVVVALAVPLAPLAIFAERSTGMAQWFKLLGDTPVSMLALASGLLLVASVVVALAMRSRRPVLAGTVALTALLNFYAVSFGQMLPRLDALWVSRSAAQALELARPLCPASPVASVGYAEPSLVFLVGTATQLRDSVDVLTPLAELPERCQLVLISEKKLAAPFAAADALASFTGFNYSKGEHLKMYLFLRKEIP